MQSKDKEFLEKLKGDTKLRKYFREALLARKKVEEEISKSKTLMNTGIFNGIGKHTKLINLNENSDEKQIMKVLKKRGDFNVFLVGSMKIFDEIKKLKSFKKFQKSISVLKKYLEKHKN
jgi:hypothetical protein